MDVDRLTRRKMNRFLAAQGVSVSGAEKLDELRAMVRAVTEAQSEGDSACGGAVPVCGLEEDAEDGGF